MGKIIKCYVLPTDPLTLDELTINSHEKSIMADRLIHQLSSTSCRTSSSVARSYNPQSLSTLAHAIEISFTA